MNEPRRPFAMLGAVVAILGAAALAASWLAYPPSLTAEFYLLLIAAVVSENYAVMMPGYSYSIVYPLTMAAVVLCGPTPAMLIATLTSTSLNEFRRRRWSTVAYNFGQVALSTFVTGWVYIFMGGRVLVQSGHAFEVSDFPAILVPLAACAVAGVVANIVLASIGVAAKHGRRLMTVIDSVSRVFWGQLALGASGFLIAQVMALEVWAFALFVVPLLVARQFYQSFTAMQEAYTDTIRSLVGALEAKDPYTRGHSERVAEYSLLLAREAGMDGRALGALENAALLHDLGKLALSGALLRKVDKLDGTDWEAIRRHPKLGADMVRRIPAVASLADSVEMHHERLDGSGYPKGLANGGISREARIMAIADSYDAMTSDRPYRSGLSSEAAVAELERCAVKELDSELVSLFVGAIMRTSPRGASEDMQSDSPMGGE